MSKSYVHRVEGAIGTRKSPRVYTHAIVGVRRIEEAVAAARASAALIARIEHAYHVREANPATRRYEHNPAAQANTARVAALTVQQYMAERADAAEAREREHATEPVVLQWSMSERAAVAKLGYWRYYDVSVYPVIRSEK